MSEQKENLMDIIQEVKREMIRFDAGSPERIQHFLKVHSFAQVIGIAEDLDERTLFILELTALTHDIGIRIAEEKYGYSNGQLQEQEGGAVARELLKRLQIEDDIVERVCDLIGKHHTYHNIDGLDYRILLEADFLVNLYENNAPQKAIEQAFENIFETKTGKQICQEMFFGITTEK